jgi:signal transduction histidine kinase
MSKLGIRRRLLLAVAAAVTFALVGLVVGFNLILERTLNHDANDLVRARATAQLATLRISRGKLVAGEAPDDRSVDAYAWLFAGRRLLESPQTAEAITRGAATMAAGRARFLDVPSTDTRLYAEPVVVDGKRLGTVVAGVSLAPYEQTQETALIASLVLGVVALLIVLLSARWLLAHSLRPVVQMTRQAAEWSEHDLDHRFALGPPHDELTELAATLDGLLDRLAASLRRERLFSAELSHELRTPLARVLAESELALRRERRPAEYREALRVVHRSADQLSRTVAALVAAASYESGGVHGTADAHAVAMESASACAGLAADRGINLQVPATREQLRVGVDADLAERILQPVVENACRYGVSRVTVSVGKSDSTILYMVVDDGPGVDDGEAEQIFEPGARGSAADGMAGSGLGLALSRRLARSVDGVVAAEPSSAGGRFIVRLPAA